MSSIKEAQGLHFNTAPAPHHAFWSTTAPLPSGLAISVHTSDLGHPVLRVAPVKRYVPAGTHAPVQVQATYTLDGGRPTPLQFSAQFVYGPRVPLPEDLEAQVRAEATVAVAAVVVSAPSFAGEWDAATGEMEAERAERDSKLASRVAAAVATTLAAAGTPVDSERLSGDPRIVELTAELTREPADTPTGDEVVARAAAALTADAAARIEKAQRLSGLEFTALLAERLSEALPGVPTDSTRRAAEAVYDVAHAVYYGTGHFPDRAPGEPHPS